MINKNSFNKVDNYIRIYNKVFNKMTIICWIKLKNRNKLILNVYILEK